MDKYIFELIDIVQKGNKDKVINLLIIFQNQIKSYIDILPMPKGRGFLDTNDTCLLK